MMTSILKPKIYCSLKVFLLALFLSDAAIAGPVLPCSPGDYTGRAIKVPNNWSEFQWPQNNCYPVMYGMATWDGDRGRFGKLWSYEGRWEWGPHYRHIYNTWWWTFNQAQGIGVALSPSDEDADRAVWLAAVGNGDSNNLPANVYTVKDTHSWTLDRGGSGNSWIEVPQCVVRDDLPWTNFTSCAKPGVMVNEPPGQSYALDRGELRVIRPNSVRWHPSLRIPAIPSGPQADYFGQWTQPSWNGSAWVVISSKVSACVATLRNSLPSTVTYTPACSRAQQSLALGTDKNFRRSSPNFANPSNNLQPGLDKPTRTQQGAWRVE